MSEIVKEHKCCPDRGCGNCLYCYGDCDDCNNLNCHGKECNRCYTCHITDPRNYNNENTE